MSTKLEHYQELDTDDHIQNIRDTTHAAVLQAFGKKELKRQDWYNANIAILQPLIEEKRDALQDYQRNLSPRSLEALREARSCAKEECKHRANNYWMSLYEIQSGQLMKASYYVLELDGKLFNPARLRAKTKVRRVMQRNLLFSDDVAVVAKSEDKLQTLLD